LREIIERISLEDSFIDIYFPQKEIKSDLNQNENEKFISTQLEKLNQLTIENFSKSTLDHTDGNIFFDKDFEENEEDTVCLSTISYALRKKDDQCFMEKTFLFWKEHLPSQKRI